MNIFRVIFNISIFRHVIAKCTGVTGNTCCFGHTWDETRGDCIQCRPGFFGNLCEQKCTYPNYGLGCQEECFCSEERCNFSFGCETNFLPETTFVDSTKYSVNELERTTKGVKEENSNLWDLLKTGVLISFCVFIFFVSICIGLLIKVYHRQKKRIIVETSGHSIEDYHESIVENDRKLQNREQNSRNKGSLHNSDMMYNVTEISIDEMNDGLDDRIIPCLAEPCSTNGDSDYVMPNDMQENTYLQVI